MAALLGLCRESNYLVMVVDKLFDKERPKVQQEALEEQIRSWLRVAKEKWGDEDAEESNQAAFDRLDGALEAYMELVNRKGESLDCGTMASQAALKLQF